MQFLSPEKLRMKPTARNRNLFIRYWLIIILLAFFVPNVNAQQDIKVKFGISVKPLAEALDSLSKTSGISIGFPIGETTKYQSVSIPQATRTLEKTLRLLLQGTTLTYRFLQGKVIVFKRQAESDEPATKDSLITVHGTVMDDTYKPIYGATVMVAGTGYGTVSEENGQFILDKVPVGSPIRIVSMGYEEQTFPATSNFAVVLKKTTASLEDVTINTGYQSIPKERATGSFVQIDNTLLNRSVSTNILDRLKGIASGLIFDNNAITTQINTTGFAPNGTGILIRGQSSINANINPLIVVDNFPYDGDIRNINPNDVESITILKDAAAASIWGASSGNGVIVITTKKGRFNQKMKVDFNSNITVTQKPNLNYDRNFLNASDYIDVETYLFNQGFYNADLTNTFSFPAITPAVQILNDKKNGLITEAEATDQLNDLRSNDVRKDILKYVYQKAISQQYSLGIRGGTSNATYQLSVGIDKNISNLKRNSYNRVTINSQNTYEPIKNLEFTAAINYSQNTTRSNNDFDYTSGAGYYNYNYNYSPNAIIPYLQLADSKGNALSIDRNNLDQTYIDETSEEGFLDWNYRPLDEIRNADNSTTINDLLLRASVKYKIKPFLNAEVQYQNERQIVNVKNNYNDKTYYTRNLINKYLQYDPGTESIKYIIPLGEIISRGNFNWQSYNLRGQINYDQLIGKNRLTAIAGAEIRERKTTGYTWGAFGYDPNFGTGSLTSFDYTKYYTTNPSGIAKIPGIASGSTTGALYRYISYFSNIAYTYDNKYTLTLSGRKDGANIFGAKSNDKITPLWSAGLAWDISKEQFYNVKSIPYLKLRLTYGYNGNVYNGSAYLIGGYFTNPYTQATNIDISNPANPELRWERVRNINLGFDFSVLNNAITGSIELYKKMGLDLIEPTPLAPQTGFVTFMANTAATKTNGIDITLTSHNLEGKFTWNSTLLFSLVKDKLTTYEVPQTSGSIRTDIIGVIGRPLKSIYSYKWAGLDPKNGDPLGYVNGQVSKDYTAIINNYSPDSLFFNGSAIPTKFGSLRNDFSYAGFSLSVNILYELGYFFRKSTISPNYSDIILKTPNVDFTDRWQSPGDEKRTNVPSVVYPSNPNRSTFYQYSNVQVDRADNIRLQDIRLSYDIGSIIRKKALSAFQVFVYANNIGIIWRANKDNIDPDYYAGGASHILPAPFSLSFGLTANF